MSVSHCNGGNCDAAIGAGCDCNCERCGLSLGELIRRGHEHGALATRIATLEAEVQRLKSLLDRDRTGLAYALARISREVSGRMWVADSRGCYAWDDDAYKAEAGDALRKVQDIATEALGESGRVANEAFHPRLTVQIATLEADLERARAEVAYLRAHRAYRLREMTAWDNCRGIDWRWEEWLAANPMPAPPEGVEP